MPVAYSEPPAKLIVFWDDFEEASGIQVKHQPFQDILDLYLDRQDFSGVNRFDYERVSEADHDKLNEYLDYLQRLDPRQFNRAEAKSYWINLYNAGVIELVIAAYRSGSVETIRELRSGMFSAGPWKRKIFTVTMQKMSLDDIQHGVIRPIWQDHRTHFVLTKATIGGANLPQAVLTAQNIEEVLENAQKGYLSHPRAVRLDGDVLVLSSLFDWYASDFADDEATFLEFLRGYVPANIASPLSSSGDTRFEYDWALNKPGDN